MLNLRLQLKQVSGTVGAIRSRNIRHYQIRATPPPQDREPESMLRAVVARIEETPERGDIPC